MTTYKRLSKLKSAREALQSMPGFEAIVKQFDGEIEKLKAELAAAYNRRPQA